MKRFEPVTAHHLFKDLAESPAPIFILPDLSELQ